MGKDYIEDQSVYYIGASTLSVLLNRLWGLGFPQ